MMVEPSGQIFGTVTVSDRGQIVIPASARQALGIEKGEKLLVLSGPPEFGGVALLFVRVKYIGQMLSKWSDVIRVLHDEGLLEAAAEERLTEEE
jgi:AbrB family looped-hinge helix DNA binding protein